MTARESDSSRGQYADPKRASPVMGPRADLKALPRARNVSSAVWWSSTGGFWLALLSLSCGMSAVNGVGGSKFTV